MCALGSRDACLNKVLHLDPHVMSAEMTNHSYIDRMRTAGYRAPTFSTWVEMSQYTRRVCFMTSYTRLGMHSPKMGRWCDAERPPYDTSSE
jgi:hypothetical protein